MTIDTQKIRTLATAAAKHVQNDDEYRSPGYDKDCWHDDVCDFANAMSPGTIAGLLDEITRLEKRLAFTEQWNANRFETLFHWAHQELVEPQLTQYFNIVANGSSHPDHPPTYAQQFNRMKQRAEEAEKERDQLQAEVELLRGLKPEAPPYPPAGNGLPRYGLRWNGPTQPLAVPMDNGYWTPWHLADQLRIECEAQSRSAFE